MFAAALLLSAAALEGFVEARVRARLSSGATFVDFEGRRLHYRLEGAGRPGPTLVFLNGFGASLEQWELLKARLGPLATMLSFDRSGLGLSEGWGDRDGADQVRELDAALRVPGVKGPLVIVSYSTSSLAAAAFANRHPDQVGGMIFLDPVIPEQIVRFTPNEERAANIVYVRASLKHLIKNTFGIARALALLQPDPHPLPGSETLVSARQAWATLVEGLSIAKVAHDGIGLHGLQGPVAVLSTRRSDLDPYFHEMYKLHRLLIARSAQPIFRDLDGVEHGWLLVVPGGVAASAEVVRTALSLWFGLGAAGSPEPDRAALAPPVPRSGKCVVYLHGKGERGRPSSLDGDVMRISPQGNSAGWGGFAWSYFPEEDYQEVRSIVGGLLVENGCTRAIVHGFSNGAAATAKLYCRGQDFGGRVVGFVVDDPVPDHGVEGCRPAPGVKVKLYSTGALAIAEDGWRCSKKDWTCEGGTTVGIDRYAELLGSAKSPSVHTSHEPYRSPPEYAEWLK